MTSDEQRNACINAMARAMANHVARKDAFYRWELMATAAFDAMHGIAFVVPIEATEEMVEAADPDGDSRWWLDTAINQANAAGDLTNAQKKKP